MKRNFKQFDESIPRNILDKFPSFENSLDKVNSIESTLDKVIQKQEQKYAFTATPSVVRKILRVFIHHKFFPKSETDQAHFIINVEGHILCPGFINYCKFGNFFDKIRFQVERKSVIEKQFEWNSGSHPEGVNSDAFRVKIYGEKSHTVKIFLYRSNDPSPRYEVSSKLRAILPKLAYDSTEEEVLLGIWSYIQNRKLFTDGKDKRQIRCDEYLKDLLGTTSDIVVISSMRQKILEQMTLCNASYPAVQVDYVLTIAGTKLPDASTIAINVGPAQMARAGGKAVDVEVDVLDYARMESVRVYHELASSCLEAMQRGGKLEGQLMFYHRRLRVRSNQLSQLSALVENPFRVDDDERHAASTTCTAENIPLVNDLGSLIANRRDPSWKTDYMASVPFATPAPTPAVINSSSGQTAVTGTTLDLSSSSGGTTTDTVDLSTVSHPQNIQALSLEESVRRQLRSKPTPLTEEQSAIAKKLGYTSALHEIYDFHDIGR